MKRRRLSLIETETGSRMEMGEKQIEGNNAELNGRILNHILFQAQNILVNLHKIDLHH